MDKISFFRKLSLYLKPREIYLSEDGHIVIQDAVENGRQVRVLFVNGVRESGIYLDEGMDRDRIGI